MRVKRGFWAWLKVLAYPLVRPARDIRSSLDSIKATAEAARKRREAAVEASKQIDELLSGKSPQEKFEANYEACGWTEQELACQLLATRRTRISSLLTTVVAFFGVLVVMWHVQGWVLVLLGAASMALVVTGVLQCIRFAWWEYEIESRSLIPLREFISRPDLIRRMFRL